MSDAEVIEKKRGRPATTAKTDDDSEKVDLKKRPRESSPAKKENVTENGSSPPKRGRGRPKGTKKGGKLRKPPVPGRGRGRPKVITNPPKNESATDETEEEEEQESASDS